MATIQKFEDLKIWQNARLLSQKVYPLTFKEPVSLDFRPNNQVRRSCGSIMDSIADGFKSGSKFEFVNALTIAKGEAGELKSQLYRSLGNNYISQQQFQELYSLADQLTKMTTGFINHRNHSKIKGQKFKNRLKDE